MVKATSSMVIMLNCLALAPEHGPWRSCTVREIIIDRQLNYLFLSTSAGARAYSGGYLSPRTPLAAYFTARYFGLSSFSELQGYNMAVMPFCCGIAPEIVRVVEGSLLGSPTFDVKTTSTT
jgi:hypothetical protein